MKRLSFLLLAACHRGDAEREHLEPVSVHCVAAAHEAVDVRVTLRGRIAAPPGGDLPVASQVAGKLVQVLVREGDHTEAGATIAIIDDSASRDAVRQAEAAVTQAKAAAANADATLQRTKELVSRGFAARQELDDTTSRADSAHAGVASAIAAADLAQRTLGRVQVKTSFAGVVTHVWRGPGALVDGTATTPIVQLAASDVAELDADATASQLMGISEGKPAAITLSTGGEALKGTVRARGTALDPASGLGLVRIGLEGTRPTLGTFGTAIIDVERREGVLVIPVGAMRGAALDGAEVVVCKGEAAEVRSIRVGWRDDKRVEIADGLAEGERVSIDHVLGLETGTPIVVAP
jgi:RND family efflux transporter MFP subunit